MNKKTLLFLIIIIICFIAVFIFVKNNNQNNIASEITVSSVNSANNANTVSQSSSLKSLLPVDKIEVVHFHGNNQCWSCIKVGEYALKTIKERFPEEYQSGKIVYKDINGELKKNESIVIKYQARGSSLFINAIRSEKDNIEEEINVWRLVNNQDQFISYFEHRLNKLLGK